MRNAISSRRAGIFPAAILCAWGLSAGRSQAAQTAPVTLPPALEAVLSGLPSGWENKQRESGDFTMGQISIGGAPWLIERDMRVRHSSIDACSDQGIRSRSGRLLLGSLQGGAGG